MRYMKANDKTVKMQIWDTAGQERFKSLTRSYFKGAIGVVICYEISSQDSFKRLNYWLTEVR